LRLFLFNIILFAGALYSLSVEAQEFTTPNGALLMKQPDLNSMIKTIVHRPPGKPTEVLGKSVYFSFVPVQDQGGSASNAFVSSTTAAFYIGDRNATSLSTVTFSPYITFKGSFGYTLRSNLWLSRDHWAVLGDIRYLYYPQYTWGLGGNPDKGNGLLVSNKYVRVYETFLRRIKPYLFAGVGYHFDGHFDISTQGDSSELQRYTGYDYGTRNSQYSISSGISVNLLYDARKNSVNPVPGFYGNVVYRFSPAFLGSNAYWHSIYVDLRKYLAFSQVHQNMLAFWTFYWEALDGHTPYLDLPSIGWDPYLQRSGRGFEQNRYRGKGLIYAESEYRRDLSSNGLLGFVLFTNINSVSEPTNNSYLYWHPAVGAGLRLKVNKASGTNLALDYGMSKGYSGIYLNLGETF
jgi:hypothetical protein